MGIGEISSGMGDTGISACVGIFFSRMGGHGQDLVWERAPRARWVCLAARAAAAPPVTSTTYFWPPSTYPSHAGAPRAAAQNH